MHPTASSPPPETRAELYEHAPCGYLTTGADGSIIRANATLLDWLGMARSALLGQRVQAILTPAARMFYETHCAARIRDQPVVSEISLDLACADGRRLPALAHWRRVDAPDGTLLGHRIMLVSAVERVAYERELLDQRELARLQEARVRELNANLERRVEARTAELVQLQKLESLGQLTGGVAHDFNNLLTPILISLDMLNRRYLTDPRALRMAAAAISAAERARTLVARLLAFARRQQLHASAVDLASMVQGMTPIISQSVGPAIKLRIRIPASLPPALVDRDQLEMALLNLCVNARDAMPDGGQLSVSADTVTVPQDSEVAAGLYVRFTVADTGCGMDTQTLRRSTEPFYTTKGVGKGTGLGLSMVHGLAAQSGGMLALESAPGSGTRATVWLPVDPSAVPLARQSAPASAPASAPESAPASARSSAPPSAVVTAPAPPPHTASRDRSLSILLVDDDELVRFATGEMLSELGHAIVSAASGPEALDAIRRHTPFDLLITDYLMPNMTGVELARTARAAQPLLPVLLITGYADFTAADAGGLSSLGKPFATAGLAKAIAATFAEPLPSGAALVGIGSPAP